MASSNEIGRRNWWLPLFWLEYFTYLTCKQCELVSFSSDPANGTPEHTMQLSPCGVAAPPGVSEELILKLITAKTKLIKIVLSFKKYQNIVVSDNH